MQCLERALNDASQDKPLIWTSHTCSCGIQQLLRIVLSLHKWLVSVLSILFWRGCTPTSSRSLTVNTEHPPLLCAETSCLAMKSQILWSVRLTYARKGKKNPSGLDLEYCNRQALTLFLHVYVDTIRPLVFGYWQHKEHGTQCRMTTLEA